MKDSLTLTDPFVVKPWVDPVLDDGGYHPLGVYAETFWLPVIGPSAYLLARRLFFCPGTWGKGVLASAVGIGHRREGGGPLERSLARLEGFGLAAERDGNLYVRQRWSRVTARMLAKLPEFLQAAEELAAKAERDAPTP